MSKLLERETEEIAANADKITFFKKHIKAIVISSAALLTVIIAVFCVILFAKPSFSYEKEGDLHLGIGEKYVGDKCRVKFLFFDISEKAVRKENVNTKKCGEYTVTDTVKVFGKKYKSQRKVIVSDRVVPVITLNGETALNINVPQFAEPGYSATDNVDGDITDKVTVTTDYSVGKVGTFTFNYSVKDSSGNTATAQRTVTVADNVAPVIALKGKKTLYLTVGDTYSESGATATDAFDGDVSGSISVSGTPDTSRAGNYEVVYTVKDSSNNQSRAVRQIKVYDKPKHIDGAVNGNGIVSQSTIYLTFDDGPSASVTPRILDILKANNVKATFFIINYSEQNKGIVARTISEGHTVGVHGYTHDFATAYASPEAYIDNISKLHQRLIDDFGYNTNIIRFLGGSSNTVSKKYCNGIMSALCPLTESMGYVYFDWNVSSGDAEANTVATSKIVANVKNGLRKNRGNIVLMHDTGAKTTTAAALQQIIDYGYANGYTFAGLSSYTPAVHHGIQN